MNYIRNYMELSPQVKIGLGVAGGAIVAGVTRPTTLVATAAIAASGQAVAWAPNLVHFGKRIYSQIKYVPILPIMEGC